MNEQLDIFAPGGILVEPNAVEGETLTIQEQFEAFHKANPWVYRRLVSQARTLTAKGYQHLGIGMLWEVLRFGHMMTSDPSSDFKLNNNYRSRYVRLIIKQEPDLSEAFELRELQTP